MKKTKTLTSRQLLVIDDLFAGELDEQQVLEKRGITAKTYRKWLGDQMFTEELAFRMNTARLKSQLIIARFARVAAMKLVSLTESDKEETARKACLDIISSSTDAAFSSSQSAQSTGPEILCERLTPRVASRLLCILAEEEANI